MEHMNLSITTLNNVIAQKLRGLASVTSANDIKEINTFLRESQKLRKTLYSICPTNEEEFEEEVYVEGQGDLDYMGILTQACEYIINFHSVVDFKKVKQAKAQWLLDESGEYLSELRGIFGGRIPVLPGSAEGRSEDVCVGDKPTKENPKDRES